MNAIVVPYIKGHVALSLKEANLRKMRITGMKTSNLGSTIQKYKKLLHTLDEEADELQEKLDKLQSIFVQASTESVVGKLASAISVLKETKELDARVRATVIQMKHDFGDNPVAKDLLAEAKKTQDKVALLLKDKEQFLSDLSKTHVPVYLTTNDMKFFRPFVIEVVKDLRKENSGADLKVRESKYITGINDSKKKEIRWARFIPLVDIPTIEGGKKNLFLVVAITFKAYSEEKGRITPLTITDDRGMEKPAISQYSICLTNKITDPIKLSPVLKVVSSVPDAMSVLSTLAESQGLKVFGTALEGTVEQRIEKVSEKLKIINKDGVIVENDKNRNFVLVKVPENLVDTKADSRGQYKIPTTPTKFDADLYLDVCRYAGVGTSAYNQGQLRHEKTYKEGDYVCFLYRIMPRSTTSLQSDEIKPAKKETPVLDKDFDSGLGEFTETGLNDLVNDWLGKNTKF